MASPEDESRSVRRILCFSTGMVNMKIVGLGKILEAEDSTGLLLDPPPPLV